LLDSLKVKPTFILDPTGTLQRFLSMPRD